ncbi:MAG: ATPase domain-containing protein [Candidatus Woesearchaeota archaeon]
MERVKTYIKGMDEILGGGFNKGTVALIAGGAGSGKSVLAMEFVYNGIIKDKQPGAFISFEEEKSNVYAWMKEFGWDLADLEKKKKFVFLEYTPEKVKKLLDEGGGLISTALEKIKVKRIAIDSITSFTLLFKDELQRREALVDLFKLLRRWNATTVVTGEFESNIEEHISNALEFEVDNIVLLYHPRKKDQRERSIEILKSRGSSHIEKVFPFKIGEKGIEVLTKERIDYYRRK